MSIIDFSVKKPIAMSMLLSILMMMGILVAFKIPVDLLPTIESPVLTVSAAYSGAGPEEVEVAITRPLESALSTLDGVKKITSTSREGSASVRLEYEWGEDLDTAIFDVREKIDIAKATFPDEVKHTKIYKFSSDDSPIMGFVIVGIDDPATAYDFAEHRIKKNIEQIPGVGEVKVSGGIQTEVHIELIQNRLQAYNISTEIMSKVISANNFSSAGGSVSQGVYKFGVRVDGEIDTLEGFRNIVVAYRGGIPIFLKDLAEITYGSNEDNGLTFISAPDIEDETPVKTGRSSVILEVTKTSEANTVDVAERVYKYLDELRRQLPPNVKVLEMYSSAREIDRSLKSVINSALQGGFFALIIIFFYLWDWRSLLVVFVSIPTSIIITLIAMYFAGLSFNTISLAGLTLAIGMMVDSSIVVLENIFRYKDEGYGKYSSAIKGTQEVFLAITASTFTTIAVFAPILFLEGREAQLFKDLVVTIVVGLLASLMISVTLIPMLCSLVIKEVPCTLTHNNIKSQAWNNKILDAMDSSYYSMLEICMRHKKKLIGFSLVFVLLAGVVLSKIMGQEYMPSSDEGQITVNLTYPLGTRYEQNEKMSRQILNDVRNKLGERATLLSLQVKLSWQSASAVLEHRSRLRATLVPRDERDTDVPTIADELRPILAKYPVRTYISTGMWRGGSGGESINLEILGNDMGKSHQLAEDIIALFETLPCIKNPRNTSDDAVTELVLKPDRVSLARAGISPRELFSIIKTSFGGENSGTISSAGGNTIDIRIRVREEDRISIENLRSLRVTMKDGRNVPLRELVDIVMQDGPRDIRRSDSTRMVNLRASIPSEYAKDVTGIVDGLIIKINENVFIPVGTRIAFRGDYEDGKKSTYAMIMAFLLAMFIVYSLMAALFESYIAPLVIMISVPFGAVGSMLLLWLAGISLNVYSMIGMVILVGIVINNGIVLVDYMNLLLHQGLEPDEAALKTGLRRFRPVCMTTLTTVCGMIPMAMGLGDGEVTYAALATSMIGGLVLSMVFTLFIVPTLYAGIRKRIPIRKTR